MDNTSKEKDDSNDDDLRKKLKQSEESRKMILNEYLKCEKELRVKTEEAENLKTEIKDLKEIAKLSEQLMKENLEASMNDEAQHVVDDLVDANKDKDQNKENLKNK